MPHIMLSGLKSKLFDLKSRAVCHVEVTDIEDWREGEA